MPSWNCTIVPAGSSPAVAGFYLGDDPVVALDDPMEHNPQAAEALDQHMDVDLRACLQGNELAWDAFLQRYAGVIYAAVGHVFGQWGAGLTGRTVEDIAQDIFIRLIKDDYQLLRKYQPGRASLETWLTLIARSAAIDCLRKRRLDTSGMELSEVPATEPTAHDNPVPLHLLTARQRLVLRLLFDEDRSVTEVAQILGVEEQTIRSTKHKALSRLRSHFQSE